MKQRFSIVDAGRGVAAALVVAFHAGHMLSEARFAGAVPFGGLLDNFNVGVDFFFVLSGFIMVWIHWDDLGKPARFAGFARKRVQRIYPLYLSVLMPLLLYKLAAAFPDFTPAFLINVFCSITLLPGPDMPILGVAWTLQYEMVFYFLVSCAILCGKRLLCGIPVWALAILLFPAELNTTPFPQSFLLNPYHLDFFMGLGVALLLRRVRVPAPVFLTGAGASAFALLLPFASAIQLEGSMLAGRLVFGGAIAVFVAGAVEWERQYRVSVPRALVLLGEASFAIYLVHVLVLIVSLQIVFRLFPVKDVSAELLECLFAPGTILAGIAFHLVFERRLTAWVKRQPAARQGAVPPLDCAGQAAQ